MASKVKQTRNMSIPNTPQNPSGYGDPAFEFAVYIGNTPSVYEHSGYSDLQPMKPGDIASIVQQTGNHWRKIFNLYAKLMHQLEPGFESEWQQYREGRLLQRGSKQALLFSQPQLGKPSTAIHLVTGKSHAEHLGLLTRCDAINEHFYVNCTAKLIVSPYFDYRQLSNRKLETLVEIVRSIR